MPKVLRRLLVALATLAGLLLILVVAWGLDLRAHDGEALRNTSVGGHPIGGLQRSAITRIVERVGDDFEEAEIRVDADGGGFKTSAASLGVTISGTATVDAALNAGREGNPAGRLFGWMVSFVRDREVTIRVAVDEAAVYRTVREEDPGDRKEPVEPHIALEEGALVAKEGERGRGIDAADVIEALPDAAAQGVPYVVEVDRGDVEPRFSVDEVEGIIVEARRLIDEAVDVSAGGVDATLRATTVRSWLRSRATDNGLEPYLDRDAALRDLGEALKDAGTPATETKLSVEGGAVKIVPGRSGSKCCAPSAVDLLERALLFGSGEEADVEYELSLTEREPRLTEAEARELRIVEPVATFTTKHPAGQPRVANIHRIADLVRGQVIEPGESFSVNDFVGRRTKERGFVAAPVIEEGRFTEDVGGGISQFATTLFNAAFLAGLEFGEYQSHSIYIARYPYGREATLSYPHPDLVIENPTPYGVLIWPTYTGDSITVTLYSTKHLEASQTGQTKAPRGNCTRVTTERTRRYPDGRTEVDRVFATYRPAEGVNC